MKHSVSISVAGAEQAEQVVDFLDLLATLTKYPDEMAIQMVVQVETENIRLADILELAFNFHPTISPSPTGSLSQPNKTSTEDLKFGLSRLEPDGLQVQEV